MNGDGGTACQPLQFWCGPVGRAGAAHRMLGRAHLHDRSSRYGLICETTSGRTSDSANTRTGRPIMIRRCRGFDASIDAAAFFEAKGSAIETHDDGKIEGSMAPHCGGDGATRRAVWSVSRGLVGWMQGSCSATNREGSGPSKRADYSSVSARMLDRIVAGDLRPRKSFHIARSFPTPPWRRDIQGKEEDCSRLF